MKLDEDRQHGMVRTYQYQTVPPSINHNMRTINAINPIRTGGIFDKVKSLKPANHSKFTEKCGKLRLCNCQGSLQLRGANNDVSRVRLVTRRVVGGLLGLGTAFGSASEILKRLDDGNAVVMNVMKTDSKGENDVDEDEWMDGGDEDADEDETMSFCEVGYVWEQVDSWCLVAEM